jgi:mannosidase alpha-like ER degradation enhancer 2
LLLQRPLLMQQFYEYEDVINKYIRKEDWFMWVSMTKGQVNFPVFQSLEAFWPGVLVSQTFLKHLKSPNLGTCRES